MKELNKYTYDEIVRMNSDSSLDTDTKSKIVTYLNELRTQIDNLEFIDKIGLKLENNLNGLVLKRSNSGKRIDFLAVFIGFLSIPILGLALGKFIHLVFYDTLTLKNFIPIGILLIIGGVLLALFLKGWDRRFKFAGFSFEKNSSYFKLKQMSNFTIKETTFHIDSKLSLNKNGKKVTIVLSENEIENSLFDLPELSRIQNETLTALISKFN